MMNEWNDFLGDASEIDHESLISEIANAGAVAIRWPSGQEEILSDRRAHKITVSVNSDSQRAAVQAAIADARHREAQRGNPRPTDDVRRLIATQLCRMAQWLEK